MQPKTGTIAVTISVTIAAGLLLPVVQASESSGERERTGVAAAVEAFRDFHGITGGAIAILHNRQLIYRETFGEADLASHAPVDGNTRFQLSSSTKLFTGTLMAMLARDGLVDFAAPVRKYLQQLPESWSDVLLEDIMAHLSGLPEVLECNESADREAALRCVQARERPGPRRERFRYSQTNYLLALMVVEAVTGDTFADALAERVLGPAGMTCALWSGDSHAAVPRRATGYYPDEAGGVAIREYQFPTFLMSAAGLNATLTDMIAFARALDAGVLVDAAWRERMWRAPVMASGSAGFYAIGWDLRELRDGGHSAGHEGGSLTTFRVYPGARLSVIVLTNGVRRYFGLDSFADLLAELVVPDILPAWESQAYRARLRYLQDGVEAAFDTLADGDCANGGDAAKCNDLLDWLAEELDEAGRSGDAALLRAKHKPAP
ncbi:MAG: beta-lactamase family protein [Gammaproteobacteria bacterium]|nr:beta-lactamase family protein [Gammaproteobacteria bacterium]MDH5345104.1 beta-lactamase family protein [Gammaproteobacteria bacterium]